MALNNLKTEEEVQEYLKNLGIEYRFGCYSEKNPEVCHLLGDYLESIKKDYKKASKVYKANCDDYKYARSCYKFGSYLLLGRGLKQNYKESHDYFDQGCNLNHPQSCLQQALMLVSNNESRGIPTNPVKGMELLEKACRNGSAEACYSLSGLYLTGIRKSTVTAKEYEEIDKEGYAIQKDMEKAFTFAVEGCNLGHIYSCVNLSQMYARGEGVKKDPKLAEKYKKMSLEMADEISTNKTLKYQQGLK